MPPQINKTEEKQMTVEEFRNMKTESKISIWKSGRKEYVAEVVENCGCGFDYLIRINPDYKDSVALFGKCLKMCGVNNFLTDIEKADADMENCIDRGYIIGNENIAIVLDKII